MQYLKAKAPANAQNVGPMTIHNLPDQPSWARKISASKTVSATTPKPTNAPHHAKAKSPYMSAAADDAAD